MRLNPNHIRVLAQLPHDIWLTVEDLVMATDKKAHNVEKWLFDLKHFDLACTRNNLWKLSANGKRVVESIRFEV